jgi:hypothetical protein
MSTSSGVLHLANHRLSVPTIAMAIPRCVPGPSRPAPSSATSKTASSSVHVVATATASRERPTAAVARMEPLRRQLETAMTHKVALTRRSLLPRAMGAFLSVAVRSTSVLYCCRPLCYLQIRESGGARGIDVCGALGLLIDVPVLENMATRPGVGRYGKSGPGHHRLRHLVGPPLMTETCFGLALKFEFL